MPEEIFLQLVSAVRAGNIDHAAALLGARPDLDEQLDDAVPDSFGSPLLFIAAAARRRDMVGLLLDHGADINTRSDWWAGSFGILDGCDPQLAPFLMERGATLDAHSAARLGLLPELMQITKADPAVVHARGGDGQTPLHFASTVESAAYLLEHGADIDARDVDHESTPAQWMMRDRKDVARFLVTKGCRTDILMASALGAMELVRRHIDGDPASIRTRVSPAYFPMHDTRAGGTIYNWTLGGSKTAHMLAREFGHEDIFQLLMERTPDALKLAQACLVGDERLAASLSAHSPSLTGAERRLLGEVLWNDNVAAARLMLRHGWPVDTLGDSGETPLHVAAWFGMSEIVADLLARKASVERRDTKYQSTPLGWCVHGSTNCWRRSEGDYVETEQRLVDAGALRVDGG